ncbi:ferrous iron transport protein B [Paenibacillus sp. JX-17]|uniref:Ferrous iron transport protein B n=1 Tax=Paenibacillus lacisoli TaxID=3064525 RepID=A0ABT9CJ64_9BACL|nr:ferrous iron transport protein B [Paenibacillus sp. JX-17]MDO7907977.1 ferrous iron transport protein B [Paenibacillus sp. JX-17]
MTNIALIGNPNTGKTSLFNALTSSYEYVGNWAGVTVEKKVGTLSNHYGELIDLPGVYSLSPLSRDESVTTHYLLQDRPDLLLNVVDASQLERNLHLTLQLLEYGQPVFIALNMTDVAARRGIRIDESQLAEQLGAAVIPVVARSEQGCKKLLEQLTSVQLNQQKQGPRYDSVLEEWIAGLMQLLPDGTLSRRWLAIQLMEGNQPVYDYVGRVTDASRIDNWISTAEQQLQEKTGIKSLRQYIRLQRSEVIKQLIAGSLQNTAPAGSNVSVRLDQVVTNKYLGIPIFLLFMYLTFKLTFDWVGTPVSDLLDSFLNGPLSSGLTRLLDAVNAASFIKDVILNGIVAGVGGVLVFVPQIFMLFLIISFIEDSGYMARIATVMDRLMEGVGLNGKAFIPMIIGFGCNVPGIMAARTIEQPKERLLTILLTPLMSCSARLSVYSLFVGTFFQSNQALIVLSLYVLGVVVALVLAKLFSTTLSKEEESFFVVELPPYRIPQWKTLARSTWEKGKGFVRKAGTFIFGGSVVIWLLSYTGLHGWNVPINESFLKNIGSIIAPVLSPLGFGDWQAAAALLTGFLAKEVVVSTMNIIYAAPSVAGLQGELTHFFTPLQSYSFMVFILLYVPCLATVGVIRKETSSAKWTWFSVGYALVVAYLISFVIYRVGLLLGF